jgi:hypothetical protein
MVKITIPKADKGYTITLTAQDDTGVAKSLAGYTVTLQTWLPETPDTIVLSGTCTVTDATNGICTYTLAATDFATANVYHARLLLTKTGFIEALKPFAIMVEGAFHYCSLAEIKSELFTGTNDVNDYDDLIETLCEEVEKWIDDVCGRTFKSALATKYFDGAGGTLFIDDLISVTTSLKLDEDADGTYESTMTASDYILYPLNETPKTYIKTTPSGDYGGFASGVRKGVEIIGTWGYGSTVPTPVRRVAKIKVIRLFKGRESAYATRVAIPGEGDTSGYTASDKDLERMLQPYKKRSL